MGLTGRREGDRGMWILSRSDELWEHFEGASVIISSVYWLRVEKELRGTRQRASAVQVERRG